MYYYSGKVADGWRGWDGKSKIGDAPAGLYYYYFEAEGWGPFATSASNSDTNAETDTDTNATTDENQGPSIVREKGFFYLFRNYGF